MPTAHEARVPHILQNDVEALSPIRCGPACTQAILYGLEDSVFGGAGGSALIPAVPVATDQEKIWKEIKRLSTSLATQLGGHVGDSEDQQVCTAGGQCWATHPDAMAEVLRVGVQTTAFPLSGNASVTAQMLPEGDVPVAVVDSLSQGVGAAILINRSHWVVAYKTTPLGAHDVDIHFHDPLHATPLFWNGVGAMVAAILDVEPTTTDTSETAVVGARTEHFTALREELPLPAPLPIEAAPGPRFDDLAQQDVATILGESVGSMATVGVPTGPGKPTRVLPVRHLWNPRRSYTIVEFHPHTMVIVDTRTHVPRLTTGRRDETSALPTILNADQAADAATGQSVWFDGREVVLQAERLRIMPELIWAPCQQSLSMFIPFYAADHDRGDGGEPDHLFVRANDGKPFARLTP